MPINSIVAFSFSRLVAWFNKRHELALQLQSSNQLWLDKPLGHLAKAKDKARTHELECFDHATGKYQVTKWGGTTSDVECLPSRSNIVILIDFSCTCGRPR